MTGTRSPPTRAAASYFGQPRRPGLRHSSRKEGKFRETLAKPGTGKPGAEVKGQTAPEGLLGSVRRRFSPLFQHRTPSTNSRGRKRRHSLTHSTAPDAEAAAAAAAAPKRPPGARTPARAGEEPAADGAVWAALCRLYCRPAPTETWPAGGSTGRRVGGLAAAGALRAERGGRCRRCRRCRRHGGEGGGGGGFS